MRDLRSLIERVEKLDGPSREVDGAIWCAINSLEFVMWDGAGCVYRGRDGIGHIADNHINRWTASLDAAIALCERVLPGWTWTVSDGDDHGPNAFVHERDDKSPTGSMADTPALALVLATLRALEAQGGKE